MLEVVCKEYGDAFRKTYPGRNVPLKTHVVEYELPKFARRWFAAGLLCEDAAESIHAVMNRLRRRYACVREKKAKVAYTQSALNLYQDSAVRAESDAHHQRRARNFKIKEDCELPPVLLTRSKQPCSASSFLILLIDLKSQRRSVSGTEKRKGK
jgi:hypothetical protein